MNEKTLLEQFRAIVREEVARALEERMPRRRRDRPAPKPISDTDRATARAIARTMNLVVREPKRSR